MATPMSGSSISANMSEDRKEIINLKKRKMELEGMLKGDEKAHDEVQPSPTPLTAEL